MLQIAVSSPRSKHDGDAVAPWWCCFSIATSLQEQQQRVEEAEAAVAAAAESATGLRLQQLRQQQKQITASLQQEQQQQEQLNAAFDKGQLLLQQIRDSIEVKRQQQQLQQQAAAIEELRVQLQGILQQGMDALQRRVNNNAPDRCQWQQQQQQPLTAAAVEGFVDGLRQEAAKKGQALAELRGSMATREERKQQLLQELNNATYKQIDVRYLEGNRRIHRIELEIITRAKGRRLYAV